MVNTLDKRVVIVIKHKRIRHKMNQSKMYNIIFGIIKTKKNHGGGSILHEEIEQINWSALEYIEKKTPKNRWNKALGPQNKNS